MDKDDEIEEDKPVNYRQVSVSSLNSTINLTSTYPKETLDLLIDRSLFLLEQVKKENNGG